MEAFDWQRILIDDLPFLFLAEVAFRGALAYILVFLFLKSSGRRGIRQLSIFELVVILTLGSASGDVIFHEDLPILPILMVFLTILLLYRITTYAMQNFSRFSDAVEGKPVTLIEEGLYELDTFKKLNVTDDEFFMELRQQSVEHLGQVRLGILEVDGNLSLFFYDDDNVKPGLSVLPPEHRTVYDRAPTEGQYACSCCGYVLQLAFQQSATCPRCENTCWATAITTRRID